MKNSEKYRAWLTKNKIFFEVCSWVLFGLASIILAANDSAIARKQLDLLKLEQSPIIHVQRNFLGSREIVTIENLGQHMFEPVLECTSFLIIEDYFTPTAYCEMDYAIEIQDYFRGSLRPGNTVGAMFTVQSHDEATLRAKKLMQDLRSIAGDAFKSVGLQHVIKTSYKDKARTAHTQYYSIDSLGVQEISEWEYRAILPPLWKQRIFGTNSLKRPMPKKILSDIQKTFDEILESDDGLTPCDI